MVLSQSADCSGFSLIFMVWDSSGCYPKQKVMKLLLGGNRILESIWAWNQECEISVSGPGHTNPASRTSHDRAASVLSLRAACVAAKTLHKNSPERRHQSAS